MSESTLREQGKVISTITGDIGVPNDKRKPFEIPHPYYASQMGENRWPRYRALQDGFEEADAKMAYLPKFPYELENMYKHRVKITHFLGASNIAVERLVGAVFASEPNYRTSSENLKEWLNNIDGEGTTLRDFMESASGEANWMSMAFAIVTKKKGKESDEVPVNRAQQIEAGDTDTPLIEMVEVEKVPSWGMDDNGNLAWAAVCEVIRTQSSPSKPAKKIQRWRVFTAEKIEVYERNLDENNMAISGGEELTLSETIVHGFGGCPVVPIAGRFIKKMQAESFIKASSRADLAKLMEDSWGAQMRSIHANPLMKISSDREIDALYIGGNAVRLEKDEELAYADLPSSSFDIRAEASESLMRQAIQQTGSNPQLTTDGATHRGESGVGQMTRFSQTEKRHILRHTRALEMATCRIMDLAQIIIEDKEFSELGLDDINSAQYFNTFEILELQSLVTTYNQVAPAIESPTFHAEAQQNIAMRIVADAPQDVRDKIKEEIKSTAASPDDDEDVDQ